MASTFHSGSRVLILLASIVTLLTLVTASPLNPKALNRNIHRSGFTFEFVPFATNACEMSTNPFNKPPPTQYNLTTNYCVTPEYTFGSYYVNGTTEALNTSCTLTLWDGKNCSGETVEKAVEGFSTCDIPMFTAGSVTLHCED